MYIAGSFSFFIVSVVNFFISKVKLENPILTDIGQNLSLR